MAQLCRPRQCCRGRRWPKTTGTIGQAARPLDRACAACYDAFEGREAPDTGPAWCHSEATQIPTDADAVLAAHLLGERLLEGDVVPDNSRGYGVPKSLEVLQHLSGQADLQLLQAYAAYGLQQHLLLLGKQEHDKWRDTLDALTRWAVAVGALTVCDVAPPTATAGCVQRWVSWLHWSSQLSSAEFSHNVAVELALRLRSTEAEVVAMALHNLVEDKQLEAGEQPSSPEFNPLHDLVPWVQRNWLLTKDLSAQEAALFNNDLSLQALHAILYPVEQTHDLLHPSDSTQLHAVDLPQPPPKKPL